MLKNGNQQCRVLKLTAAAVTQPAQEEAMLQQEQNLKP